jgi:ATP-dependent RNA helicase DeaD
MQGKDMVGQASSGMGKTAAFTLPLLHTLVTADSLGDGVNGLVLLPTKNLAVQVAEAVRDLGRFIDGLQVVLLVGGGDIRTNLHELSSAYRQQSMARRTRGGQGQSLAPLVVVGCPGRILDLCLPPKQDAKRRPAMDLSATRIVVLDEADELLVADAYARGGSSSEQVQRLLCRNLPQDCAVALFSATLPAAALEVAEKLMRPEHVMLLALCSSDDGAAASSVIPANISEYVVQIESPDRMDMWECKFDAFVELMETTSITQQQCIVFVNSNELADWIVGMFAKHEELQWLAEISTRELAAFRGTGNTKPAWGKASIAGSGKGKRLLITTDRDGRGIDVQGVRTVFSFELPRAHKPEGYVQRVGRCGRFGRQGVAVSLVNGSSADDRNALHTVCRLYRGGLEIPELPGDDKLRHVLGMAQAATVKGQEQEMEEDAVSVASTDTSSVSSASTCSDATVALPADLVEQLQRLRELEQRLREQEQTLAKKQAELEAREQRLAEAAAKAQAQAQAQA